MWWLRLGIGIERIKPGHPEQNGRHERMHLTLKREATKPASPNFLQQQARFEAFVARYNDERPHEALDMRVPADDYVRSPRPYQGIGERRCGQVIGIIEHPQECQPVVLLMAGDLELSIDQTVHESRELGLRLRDLAWGPS